MSAKLECDSKVTHIATGLIGMVNDTAALVLLSQEFTTCEAPENSCEVVEIGAEELVGPRRYLFIQPWINRRHCGEL